MVVTLEPIGIIKSCFKEKFGIPRQPGLVPEARAVLKLRDDPQFREAVRGLEEFSHIWVIFVFHGVEGEGWRPLVRPPRLGGARKMGVLATRSPHRPAPIGMSAVALERVDVDAPGGVELHLAGVDLLDGTPVLDVKPYIAYADSLPSARGGWFDASEAPGARMRVTFSEEAAAVCESEESRGSAGGKLRELITQVLELDPRPAFQTGGEGAYAARVLEYDVHWRVSGGECVVTEIRKV